MTVSTIINQSYGAAPITPIKRALAADTSLIAFNVRVGAGAQAPAKNKACLWFAVSSFDLAAGAAPAALLEQAKLVELPVPEAANAVLIRQSESVLALGGFLYVWSDTPVLVNAVSLQVDLVEV